MIKIGNTVVAWECPNSPGEPVCITSDNDAGLVVNLYAHGGEIVGVEVYDKNDPDCPIVVAAGLVHVDSGNA